jgi:murein DD-endopeptidase MepM/ murein hydrolase activator NlpD
MLFAMLFLVSAPATSSAAAPDPVGQWPLRPDPEVIRTFDPPSVPWGAGHRGVDLLGTPGSQVHASLAGQVTFAGMLAGRGVMVVSHGPTRTTYEPVTSLVGVGTAVEQGEVIGTLAHLGSHCLPAACLHWGWLRGDTYLDPLDLIRTGAVRLLPLWRDVPVDAAAMAANAPLRFVPLALPYAGVLLRLAELAARSPPG